MVTTESELVHVEEHILACPSCAIPADEARDYVDAIRVAAMLREP